MSMACVREAGKARWFGNATCSDNIEPPLYLEEAKAAIRLTEKGEGR